MVAVNSLLYFLLSAGLSGKPEQAQDLQNYQSFDGEDAVFSCPKGEYYDQSRAHCQGNCATRGEDIPCFKISIAGCRCNNGTTRGPGGHCIDIDACPKEGTGEGDASGPVIMCPHGEHYDKCRAHCQGSCATGGEDIPCVKMCVGGCRCNKGTTRGPGGRCIDIEACPKTSETDVSDAAFSCPNGEFYDRCRAHCQGNCSTGGQDIPCVLMCIGGCRCNKGTTRGPGGRCIDIEACPKTSETDVSDAAFSCPSGEFYDRCRAHCQGNCSTGGRDIPCVLMCIGGCRCNKGTTRGPGGRCIDIEACPKTSETDVSDAVFSCPNGEFYDRCRAHCQGNCSTGGQDIPCVLMCVGGCRCNKGTTRGPGGRCIDIDQCPMEGTAEGCSTNDVFSCPSGEFYDPGRAHCQGNCSTGGEDIFCSKMCVGGCRCNKGTTRGPGGRCINIDECPKESSDVLDLGKLCPPKEHLSHCSAHCQKNCTNFDKPILCPAICVKGCVCDEGLVRGSDGKCIPPTKCPARDTCPRGEHYDQCNAHCQWNCTTYGKPLICNFICAHGCVCDEGTVRGPEGKCIKPDKCPKEGSIQDDIKLDGSDLGKLCPPKEHLSHCLAHCQKNCTNFDKPILCPAICVKGCVCDEGLVRGSDGKCIPPTKCPARDTCPRGEHYDQCNAHCQWNCTTYGKPLICNFICAHGCVCDEGTVRGPEGKCIKPDKCPKEGSIQDDIKLDGSDLGKLCPPKEHLSHCSAHCQKNCTNFDKPILCPAICVKGCVCDEGLVRGSDGKCIPPTKCPARDTCPRGEHYDQCNAHCQWNCTTYGKPLICNFICAHGCVCDEGTVRGPEGKCIKPDKCPKEGSIQDDIKLDGSESFCPVNEIHSRCLAHCQRDCSNWDDANFQCSKMCSPGCICDRGMVRGPDGQCITPSQCPTKSEEDPSMIAASDFCPPNSEYSPCDANCEDDCTGEGVFCNSFCVSGCACKKGFVRGPKGTCIKKSECRAKVRPGKLVCPEDEVFRRCGLYCQQNCTNIGKLMPCPMICVSVCNCKEGLIRGPDGKCIPKDQCPPHADSTRIYASLEDEDSTSFDEELIGTQHEEDSTLGERCPRNEKFSPCTAHCQKDCSNYKEELPCTRDCNPGCICQDDMVRGPDGKCIYPNDCPWIWEGQEALPVESNFCPPHEEYSVCEVNCEEDCGGPGRMCNKMFCLSGCRCSEGFVRGPRGKCIKKEQCPSKERPQFRVCPEDEVFNSCGLFCQANCTNVGRPLPCPRVCAKGCFCKRGLIRGLDGKCIPRDQCPPTGEDEDSTMIYEQEEDSTVFDDVSIRSLEEGSTDGERCPRNEKFSPCTAHCQKDCSNYKEELPCTRDCNPGCICQDDMVRGPDGKCIYPNDCPWIWEGQEASPDDRKCLYDKKKVGECLIYCERECYYRNKDNPSPCFNTCKLGCLCPQGSEGKHYDSVVDQFPFPILCPKNESFSVCPCAVDCDNYETKKCVLCIPGCECKSGYVKGPDGNCIRKDECPRDKKPDECTELEFYDSCGSACPDDCTNYHQPSRQCTLNCKMGCFCIPGMVRGPSGQCIFPFECTTH